MTPQRKINILNKVIKRFEEIIPKFDKDEYAYRELGGGYGICNYACFDVMSEQELESFSIYKGFDCYDITGILSNEFNLIMPYNDGHAYKWELTAKGHQARARACKKAAEYWKKQIEKKK